MSGNSDESKETHKALPLDLARTAQITTVRTADGKAPLLMTSQALRGMRVLTQATPPNPGQSSSNASTIITTNIVPQAVFKQDLGRTQITSILTTQPQSTITIQRPGQITLATTPVAPTVTTAATYHVPRGPAVVANLAAPRSNVTSVRAPMVVASATVQPVSSSTNFVRPPRTPSPAQGTAWLTNSNGSQIKGATTVLSSPVRGASVTGKPQMVARQTNVSTIRPGTILHSTITIGQNNQIHSFKPGTVAGTATATGIQALGNAVTIAQILPARTQVVYSGGNAQFTQSPKLSVANSQSRQSATTRPVTQITTARLTVPVNTAQTSARLVTPQTTVLTSARLSTVPTTQQSVTVANVTPPITNRIVTTQPIGRLSVNPQQPQVTNLTTRTLNLHSLVAVANTSQSTRLQLAQSNNKILTQSTQQSGTIHFAPIPTGIKTTPTSAIVPNKNINVPSAATQKPTGLQSQAIASVFSQQENSQAANVFIHAPVATTPRRTTPSPKAIGGQSSNISTSTTPVTTYSITSGTYFYDATGNYQTVARSFGQQQSQQSTFAALTQSSQQQQIRSTPINTQQQTIHGLSNNQQMRFNPLMVVEQSQQSTSNKTQQLEIEIQQQTKVTSSPRPSILRKRDHEGSPLKAVKNLNPVLANLPQHQSSPVSPPSRPDSRGNGHSSGGSTTISATSSPGLGEVNEDSNPHVPMNNSHKDDDNKPTIEMSPRKKPRKQQLTGNDIDEHNDDMQFISENAIKKEHDNSDGNQSDEPIRDGAPECKQVTTVRKPATASLLNSYRQTWKATHNHYLRYSDVRPKDERRPNIMDLANQCRVQEKVNGWKIYHLSTQMEDLADQEQNVYNQLNELLKCTESQERDNFDKEVNRVNELIKGNLQRIKIINDGMIEAKTQIMKIFDHKVHVTDIINRCASKRNFKKREKS